MLVYQELLEQEHGKYKMKSKEELAADGFSFQWFSYAQKNILRTFEIEQQGTKFEVELCTNDEHIIVHY